jgi:hypothetical protein
MKSINDEALKEWISDFLWTCWPEHGISPGEATEVICSEIEKYLAHDQESSLYHFPNAEALASTFDFSPNHFVTGGDNV